MKKKVLCFIICCLALTSTFAQSCQITLTSSIGTNNQSVCIGAAITPITYTVTSGASGGGSNLPNGISSSFNSGTSVVTISGIVADTAVAGTYTYSVIALGGSCTQSIVSGTITVIPLPTATISGTATICQNSAARNINFKGTGLTGPYTFTYQINGGSNLTVSTVSGSSVSVTAPTNTAGVNTYSLISVQDGSVKNCSQTQTGKAVVTVKPLPTATITGTGTNVILICKDNATPNIIFAGASGTPPYTFTYKINGGSNLTVSTTSGNTVTVAAPTSVAGRFTYSLVSVKDASSSACSQTQAGTATVTVKSLALTILTTNQSVVDPCDGYLEAVAKGTAPYHYLWSDTTLNSPYRDSVCNGQYRVIVSDSASICTDTAYAYVGLPSGTSGSNPLLVSVSSTSASKDTLCNGTAKVTVSGGLPPYKIYFGADTIPSSNYLIKKLCVGFYTVNVKDSLLNTASFIFIVGSPSTTFTNSPKPGLPSGDTLLTSAFPNCSINYDSIDSIKITHHTLLTQDSISVIWTIYQGLNNTNSPTQFAKYGNISKYGDYVYTLLLDLFCTNRASGSIRASDDISIDNRVLNDIASINKEDNSVIYPNPFTTKLNVITEKNSDIKIADISGKEVYSNKVNSESVLIDLSNLNAGVYFITITNQKTSNTKKIIKN
jgi:hypothetical protein